MRFETQIFRFDNYELDPIAGVLKKNGKVIRLTGEEYKLLLYLVLNANREIPDYVIRKEAKLLQADFNAGLLLLMDKLKPRLNFVINKKNQVIGCKFEADVKTLNVKYDGKNKSFYETKWFAFDFPKELKTSCEQYLLYFAQFLQDLGINATSNLKEEAEKVLFSVTPTDDFEALDKIREALAVYLNLPASPIVYDESFAAMRLQQQVENLQHSQKMAVREIRSGERELRLAQTVIEHQDKIIYQKDSIIEQQNKVIEKIESKSIMMDSLENKEEFEKVFEGLEVGESNILKEQIGIRFNPVTSLKTLGKKLIGKDDEIISLDLDENT